MGHLGVDFPLADFLTEAPDKAFLTGATEGRVVDTAEIDGVPYIHLLFDQPPGIEFELWVEKNDQSLPRRLVVTYRNLPGQPDFIAEFSDWNHVHPSDAEFAFQPPGDATQVQLPPVAATTPPAPREKEASHEVAGHRLRWCRLERRRGPERIRLGSGDRAPRRNRLSGPMGGAAVRGPYGGGAVRGPYGGAAVRGPYGGTAYRGPVYGYGYRAPVVVAPVPRTDYPPPYYYPPPW